MPQRPSRPQFPGQLVTAVVISHDGERWLPDCLAGLAAQQRPPQRVVAVDTGSTDRSRSLLAAALGESAVIELARDTPLGAAVQAGLDAFQGAPAPPGVRGPVTEWVWLLHDDCVPEPTALRELLAEVVAAPSVAVFGPKVLDWSGRRLVEVGLTIDSSGRPQTGLEPREVDQGQHDDAGDVLAVGTAGMLVRRDIWDAHEGLDRSWPLLGEDVDFGWRVNAAGERVRLAPRAVVRHAAALSRGLRSADAVAGSRAVAARRHGLQVVLANTSRWLAPLLVVRYVVEGLLRSVAALLRRQPRESLQELLGYATALGRPAVVVAARRRRASRTVGHGDLRGLLAPPGWRLRRLGDTVAAAVGGRDAAAQRQRRRAPVETGPVSEAAETLDLDDSGWLLAAARRPGVLLALALTALGLVADRAVLGGGLHGGRLLPPPGGAAHLWATYLASWHPVALGSATTAPPFLGLFALVSTLLFGKVWLAVDVILLGAAPLAGLAAYAAAGRLTRSAPVRVLAAVTYAVLPAVTGAVSGGRIDVVLAVVLLPLLARALAAAAGAPAAEWHRWIGGGLLLAIVMAATPYVWWLAAAVIVASLLLVAGRRRVRLAAGAVLLALPLLLLVPWTGPLFADPGRFLRGSGLPEFVTAARSLPPASVVLMHPGGPDQPPLWVLAPLLAAALAGLARGRQRPAAVLAVTTFVVGAAAAIVATRVPGPVDGAGALRCWAGFPLAVAGLGAVAGAVVAADGARVALRRHSFGWRQPAAALLAVAVVAGTATSLVGWLVRGAAGPLTDGSSALLPVFAAAEVTQPTSPRVVAIRSAPGGARYVLLRRPTGPTLGDADVAPRGASGPGGRRLQDAVRSVLAGQSSGVAALVDLGVSLVVVPNTEAAGLPGLATVDGLVRVPTSTADVWRSGVPTGELVVLPPATATTARGGSDVPATSSRRPLPAGAGSADVPLPAGPAGRLLVLAEPVSRAWRATLDGRPLPAATAYGWAQAWRLPAGGGRLHVERSAAGRTGWLAVQLAALVLSVALSLPVGRRPDDDDEAAGATG